MRKHSVCYFILLIFTSMILSISVSAYGAVTISDSKTLSAGNHCGAIDYNGNLWMWGNNCDGQLGDGTTVDRNTPLKVMEDVVSVNVGFAHTAAITSDGSLWMWGRNDNGQLGNGTTQDIYIPTKIMEDVVSVSCGYDHTAVITMDGSLWMWGGNYYGQIGNYSNEDSSIPVKIMEDVSCVSASINETLVLTNDQSVWYIGGDPSSYINCNYPQIIMNDAVYVDDYNETIIIKDDGTILKGYNIKNLRELELYDDIKSISSGGGYTAMLLEDNSFWLWGDNMFGVLGDGTTEESDSPLHILDNVINYCVGPNCVMAVTEDGSLWTWGDNYNGQLGNAGVSNGVIDYGPGQEYYYLSVPYTIGNLYDNLSDDSIVETEIINFDTAITVTSTFNDVSTDAWYYEPVLWAVENGITNGTSEATFSPNNTCTTAQIITFLWRAAGSPESYIANPFWDVTSGAYYEKAAIWAYTNGLVDGYYFNGDLPCTRSSTVSYLWKLSGRPWASFTHSFSDVSSYDTFVQAVVWAVNNGITNGTSPTEFSPYNTCTRGQIVTFLYRWCNIDNSNYEQSSKGNTANESWDTGNVSSETIPNVPTKENSSSGVTVPTQAETTGNLVWVPTNGGTKYHSSSGCSNMIDPIRVSLETALANGYTACKRCH